MQQDVPSGEAQMGYSDLHRLEEGVPLLPKAKLAWKSQSTKKALTDPSGELMSGQLYGSTCDDFETAHNEKMLCYDHDTLLTSKAIMHIGMSAFGQRPVILTLAYVISIATLCATVVFFVPRASKFDSDKFDKFGAFLKFFIAFMLGTYVTQSFQRWWMSVSSFERFLVAIQQMLFMLHTIRGRPDWRKMVERFCMSSCYILNAEVRNVHNTDTRGHMDEDALLDWLTSKAFLSEDECAVLKNIGPDRGPSEITDQCQHGARTDSQQSVCAKTRAMWSWIGELISEPVVEEGVVVLPLLLVRTITMCQACINEIDLLKMNITMQMPFMYAQLLSILVHANNTMLAVSCGMSVGSALNEIQRRSAQLSGDRDTARSEVSTIGQLYGAIQTVSFQIVILVLAPMLYVAFLHIAHMLCYPFGKQPYHLPTETLIARLHADLNQMDEQRSFVRHRHHAEWKGMSVGSPRKEKEEGNDDDQEDDADGD